MLELAGGRNDHVECHPLTQVVLTLVLDLVELVLPEAKYRHGVVADQRVHS